MQFERAITGGDLFAGTGNCIMFFTQTGVRPAKLDEFLLRFALIPARYFEPLADAAHAPKNGGVEYLPQRRQNDIASRIA
jgi:hypothetical protein